MPKDSKKTETLFNVTGGPIPPADTLSVDADENEVASFTANSPALSKNNSHSRVTPPGNTPLTKFNFSEMTKHPEWANYDFQPDMKGGYTGQHNQYSNLRLKLSPTGMTLTYKNAEEFREGLKSTLRLMLAGKYGSDYKNKEGLEPLEISLKNLQVEDPLTDEELNKAFKSILEEPEFKNYFKLHQSAAKNNEATEPTPEKGHPSTPKNNAKTTSDIGFENEVNSPPGINLG